MLNSIPVLGWALSLGFTISLSIPFWFCWTFFGLGAKYFYFLPPVYQTIPFWHCVGLFLILNILSGFVPKIATVNQQNKDKN